MKIQNYMLKSQLTVVTITRVVGHVELLIGKYSIEETISTYSNKENCYISTPATIVIIAIFCRYALTPCLPLMQKPYVFANYDLISNIAHNHPL